MVGRPVNHSGVGGLTLGGYEWLSGRYGLTVGCLLQVQIVLSDGSTKIASKDEGPESFRAVRGADHCIGVVSEFISYTHDQTDDI